MRQLTRRGTVLGLGTLALMLMLMAGVGLATQPTPAAACQIEGLNGHKRLCTITETTGRCFENADDAYWRCIRRHSGWVGRIRCSVLNAIDMGGCLFSSPIIAIARPIFG